MSQAQLDAGEGPRNSDPSGPARKADGESAKPRKAKRAHRAPIEHQGALLMPGSDAFKLHELAEKDPKTMLRLHKHLALLNQNAKALADGRFEDYRLPEVSFNQSS